MSTNTALSETSFFLEPVVTGRARRRVEEVLADFRSGARHPTRLEGRVAELLLASTAGDGMLTPGRIRAALWEGNLALTYENDGRFPQVLTDLVPVLDDPQLGQAGGVLLPGSARHVRQHRVEVPPHPRPGRDRPKPPLPVRPCVHTGLDTLLRHGAHPRASVTGHTTPESSGAGTDGNA